ncbi:MAG: hypothetical protein NZ739_07060 [Verrucomicrobiae bacterium]|nr:hypothetical protein [Verrucomicrobiae bacterium]MDW7979126.1 hypothetical protein [Verrucomicrobiales bacterium]
MNQGIDSAGSEALGFGHMEGPAWQRTVARRVKRWLGYTGGGT